MLHCSDGATGQAERLRTWAGYMTKFSRGCGNRRIGVSCAADVRPPHGEGRSYSVAAAGRQPGLETMPPRSLLCAWACALGLLAVLLGSHPASARTVTADQFADSIGVNIHAMYLDGGYRDLDQVIRCLRYLG